MRCLRKKEIRTDYTLVIRSDFLRLVRVVRLERTTSSSQSWRATNCATPGYRTSIAHFLPFFKYYFRRYQISLLPALNLPPK